MVPRSPLISLEISCCCVQVYTAEQLDTQLDYASQTYLDYHQSTQSDKSARTVVLPKVYRPKLWLLLTSVPAGV